MCELYMHGYYLKHDKSFNLVPFMGDIILRAFTSYTINQIKWRKVWDTFEENQAGKPLMLRKEHVQSTNFYNKHYTFLQIEGQKEHMTETQKWCNNLCVGQIMTFRQEALDGC